MKRISGIATASAALLVMAWFGIAWLGWMAYDAESDRRTADRRRARLPDVRLADLNGDSIRLRPAPAGGTVLVYFTTTCAYCRTEIEAMRRRGAELRSRRVLLVSSEPRHELEHYVRKHRLDLAPHLRVVRDSAGELASLFRIRRVPTILVYGRSGQLAGAFEGLTPVDRIVAAVEAGP